VTATSWRLVAAAESLGSGEPGEELEGGGMLDFASEDLFEGGVDLVKQAADAVADPGDLAAELSVEADDDLQVVERLVAGSTRRSACGLDRGAASAIT
jgi:hypothetical protein